MARPLGRGQSSGGEPSAQSMPNAPPWHTHTPYTQLPRPRHTRAPAPASSSPVALGCLALALGPSTLLDPRFFSTALTSAIFSACVICRVRVVASAALDPSLDGTDVAPKHPAKPGTTGLRYRKGMFCCISRPDRPMSALGRGPWPCESLGQPWPMRKSRAQRREYSRSFSFTCRRGAASTQRHTGRALSVGYARASCGLGRGAPCTPRGGELAGRCRWSRY